MTLPQLFPSQHSSHWSHGHGLAHRFQRIDRRHWPTSSDTAQAPLSKASTPAQAHYQRRATGPTEHPASLSPAMTAQHYEAMSTSRTSDDREGWMPALPCWSQYDNIPPPHTRDMYWTMPLPKVHVPEGSKAHEPPMYGSPSSSPSSSHISFNPNPSQFPVAPLQGSVDQWKHVGLSPTLEDGFSLSHSPPSSIFGNEPATTPSTDHMMIAAHTTDRRYRPTPSDMAQTFPANASSAAHHQRRATGPTEHPASMSPATAAQEYNRKYHYEAMSTPRSSDDLESWMPTLPCWSQYDNVPPPHTRDMYWTIPLPEVDEPEGFKAHEPPMYASSSPRPPSSSQISYPTPPQSPVAPLPRYIDQWKSVRLNPVLENGFSSSHSPPSIFDSEPATTPSTDHITAMIAYTREIVHILPSSLTSPNIVTVGDVLQTLERVLGGHDTACDRCHAAPHQTPNCECRRTSILFNSLRIRWCSSDGPSYPCQLLVERRRQR